jgi:TonB family protein
MAPSARIAEALPTTLPEDFGEWDEGKASAQPADSGAIAPAPEPPAAAPAPEPPVEAPRSRSAAGPQKIYTNEKAFLDELIAPRAATRAQARVLAPGRTAAGAIFEVVPPRSNRIHFDDPKRRPTRKKAPPLQAHAVASEPVRPKAVELAAQEPAPAAIADRAGSRKKLLVAIVAGATVVLLSLWILFSAASHAHRPAHAVEPTLRQPAASTEPAESEEFKPSPSTPAGSASAAATESAQPAVTGDAAAQRSAAADNAAPTPASSQMMNDQLNAPAQITAEMKSTSAEEAPPGALDATGLGGSSPAGSVLSAQPRPNVQAAAPKILNVSAGVAVGLLVRNTPPVYPPVAKTARVSGTVVLDATISKTGSIENLRVVTGPQMLRQAALDAVRTWRFKPYKLDNQPTEIETTINVVFSLKQ